MSEEVAMLREQYRLAVEEYHFQVDLNWRRSEYFFVLNVGTLVAASTLLASDGIPDALAALVFALGALLALLSLLANEAQHSYYIAARDGKERLEGELALGDHALKTTPGMGSRVARLGRVRTFLRTMLIAIALVNVVGIGIGVSNAMTSNDGSPPRLVVIRLSGHSIPLDRNPTIVVSRTGDPLEARTADADGNVEPFELDPGSYQVWVVSRSVCSKAIEVSSAPLQQIVLRCA